MGIKREHIFQGGGEHVSFFMQGSAHTEISINGPSAQMIVSVTIADTKNDGWKNLGAISACEDTGNSLS